ncbi:hypothetical protein EV183_004399 [Coemansia sp. RSA 2336]|nr:hypothetical protein EV183_004399 [Coemansia sp. RSA 2336]
MQGTHGRKQASTRRIGKRAVEQFPALSDAPPAYTETSLPQPAYAESSLQAPAAASEAYYHPASFPGYVTVQAANGETQALLRRPDRHGRRARGRIVRRSHRCLGHLCSLLCFVTGLLIVSAFIGSIAYVARHVLPPHWDQCAGLSVQANRSFSYEQLSRLSIESVEGMSMTNVYLRRGEHDGVVVHVVVEAAGSSEQWRDRILVEPAGGPDAQLSLRVLKPTWSWPQECIRASIYVFVPARAARLDHLYVRANAGMLRSLDAGPLPINTVVADLRNSLVQLRNLTVQQHLQISTKNSRINATDLAAGGDIVLQSSNGGVTLTRVRAQGIEAQTSNAGVRAASLWARRVAVHTANAPVWLRQIEATEVNAVTTNAAIRGDLSVGSRSSVKVQTTNAPVSLQVVGTAIGPGERGAVIRAYSTNNAVEVAAVDLRGNFDVTTTNSRALVTGNDELKYRRFTDSLKSGTYGAEPNSYIALSTSNARALLNFL